MADPNPFLHALANELVAEKLISFLPLQDVKALIQASTRTHDAVRKTKQFSSRVQLSLSQFAISGGLLTLDDLFLPKHVFLEIFKYLTIDESITIVGILREAESLSLSFPPGADLKRVPYTHSLKKVLATTLKLTSLSFEAVMLNEINPELFSEPGIRELFGRLECLEILVRRSTDLGYAQYAFQENLRRMAEMPLSLTTFRFGRVTEIGGFEAAHVKYIPNLIGATRNTLEVLELADLRIWLLEEMSTISCPRLRRLTLTTLGLDGSETIVEAFLQNQPPLVELNMTLSIDFPQSIFQIILARSSRLKKLHLKSKEFNSGLGPLKWQFLEGMASLQDFSLEQPHGPLAMYRCAACEESGEEIWERLPPNLEKISLQGFHFWRGGQVSAANFGLMLPRFANLTGLNLHRSHEAMTDDLLQSIISYCPKLTQLAFSHSVVGNFGVTGIRHGEEDKTGVSLDDLKGLIHLKILACRNISSRSLLEVLKFEHLRSFHFRNKVPLPKLFLFKVAKQNRCLESITVNTIGYSTVSNEKLSALWEELDKVNPHVRQLEVEDYTESWDEDEQLSVRFIHKKDPGDYFIRDGDGHDEQ